MSKSRKKNAITGWSCAKSEKKDKQLARQKLRNREHQILHKLFVGIVDEKLNILKGELDTDVILPTIREVSNVWSMAKDGKQRVPKTSKYYQKALRK